MREYWTNLTDYELYELLYYCIVLCFFSSAIIAFGWPSIYIWMVIIPIGKDNKLQMHL
jgi:hypothetical protein